MQDLPASKVRNWMSEAFGVREEISGPSVVKLILERNPLNEEICVVHLTAQLQSAEVGEGTAYGREGLRWWSFRCKLLTGECDQASVDRSVHCPVETGFIANYEPQRHSVAAVPPVIPISHILDPETAPR